MSTSMSILVSFGTLAAARATIAREMMARERAMLRPVLDASSPAGPCPAPLGDEHIDEIRLLDDPRGDLEGLQLLDDARRRSTAGLTVSS
mmetsp:Transcript_4740/g.9393  ORF Transcript_4740/g.9393 Transcript_4740/m.9393 type:complete len:90 (+) Transcript_4740:562-831(+)